MTILQHGINFILLLVPTEVQMLDITDNIDTLRVTWNQPLEPNGNISYSVTIIGMDSLSGTIFLNETVEVTSLKFDISDRRIFSKYSVIVVPQTQAGMGPVSMTTLQTPEEGWICNYVFIDKTLLY